MNELGFKKLVVVVFFNFRSQVVANLAQIAKSVFDNKGRIAAQ